jgi:hypothetical protein
MFGVTKIIFMICVQLYVPGENTQQLHIIHVWGSYNQHYKFRNLKYIQINYTSGFQHHPYHHSLLQAKNKHITTESIVLV